MPKPRFSLKTRFVFGLGLMLLPLLVVIGVSFSAMDHLSGILDSLAKESVAEIGPVSELQERLHQVEDAMRQERSHRGGGTVASLAPLIDRAYAEIISSSPFSQPEEKNAVLGSRHAWRQVVNLWNQGTGGLVEIDKQLHLAEQLLGQARNVALSEINLLHTQQRNSRWAADIFLGAVLLLGVGLSVLIGVVFSRAVLGPVRELEAGVRQFGDGELSARVAELSQDELGDLARTFNQMARKLEQNHQELASLSTVDFLTGLHNVREFYRLFYDETRRVDRYGHCFSLLLIDIDRFKEINDTFGHQLGDYVLQEVARKLGELIRASDHAARIGGDEFAVLLPETDVDDARDFGERIRGYFSGHAIAQVDHPDEEIRISVSIGLASYPETARNANELFAAADAALYRAKQGGRNLLCQAGLNSDPDSRSEG
ncbi:GGDEF domain-containing protein [Geothermobacter hydrogeniphilus]|uniref:diguanylate cyclase n=1 Tax=Geothermobacter hydrogeniphilus TaxID=1969733 RepID=A0A1X0Y5L8_9BACT|nr:diguanylate cyclase [Geothermobacter hydrogeniphilus]ORJ60324.1 hypothetical protein B5V00_08730 [Geothermobacter hydrogeniphilus]